MTVVHVPISLGNDMKGVPSQVPLCDPLRGAHRLDPDPGAAYAGDLVRTLKKMQEDGVKPVHPEP